MNRFNKSQSVKPKVSVVCCNSYDSEQVGTAVKKAVDAIGGIGCFVSKGETILIKPNLLLPKNPDEAATTHPEIVRAIIRLVKSAGAIPVVGDSPIGRCNVNILKNLARKTGMAGVCEDENVEFVFLIESRNVPFPGGGIVGSFDLAAYLDKVDGVISVPKLKTHSFTGITGAVKNLFGLVPGLKKSDYHQQMPSNEDFCGFLVDLAECIRPRLSVMDGVVGMEGDGPAAGDPVKIGRIIASQNPHALDSFLVDLLGAGSIRTVEIARQRGLLQGDSEIAGDKEAVGGFKMPPENPPAHVLLRFLKWLYADSISRKPVFLASRCILCGSCIDVCPVEALKAGKKTPVINREACIRCYCCQETCEKKAVTLKRMYAASLRMAVTGTIRRKLGT